MWSKSQASIASWRGRALSGPFATLPREVLPASCRLRTIQGREAPRIQRRLPVVGAAEFRLLQIAALRCPWYVLEVPALRCVSHTVSNGCPSHLLENEMDIWPVDIFCQSYRLANGPPVGTQCESRIDGLSFAFEKSDLTDSMSRMQPKFEQFLKCYRIPTY